uniref:Kinesin family member 20A n=1 Tax=Cyprinus carpio TaxID=7962 RepID=A0A8C2PQK0_CYPCA
MALASPCGLLSDEDECGAVFESTAADIGSVVRSQRFVSVLPEISVISPAADPRAPAQEIAADVSRRGSADDGSEKLKVFLRIRPLTDAEKERGEEQGCVNVQSEDSLLLRAPKDSRNMKSAERGVSQSLHKFTFTKIFGPASSQQEVYDHTIREMVRDVLRGENRLLYTYGVTNSGKTYTVQGAGGEAGLLPRAMVSVFMKLSGRLYSAMDLKPVLSQEVRKLDAREVRAEEMRRDALLRELVHGPCSKTRVAYILSLLREQPAHPNNTTLLEEEEEESDEEGDITMFDPEALLKAIDVLKREVLRQRQEKDELEATVREQVCAEMMEVITRMQDDFSETLETERDLMEKSCENKLNNLKSSLKKYYSQELEERDEEIRELAAALKEKEEGDVAPAPMFPPLSDVSAPRRSRRLASTHKRDTDHESVELTQCKAELEQCRAELDLKHTELRLKSLELKRLQETLPGTGSTGTLTTTAERKLQEGQRNLKQLRVELQMLGVKLQSGERACCRNTDGEKLRNALSSADGKLAKQDQMLVELHTSLQLVKADLRKKDELLAQLQRSQPPPAPPASGSCKKRGCGVAVAYVENQPPEKRPFFRSLFPSRTPSRQRPEVGSPYTRVLRSRQPSPPSTPIQLRVKY